MTDAKPGVWSRSSRATRTIVVLGAVLLVLAATGVLRAERSVAVSSDQAVASALQAVDFEPENVQVRLIRQGIGLRPVWAVSLSIPIPDSTEFERLATVEVDGTDGEVLRVVTSR